MQYETSVPLYLTKEKNEKKKREFRKQELSKLLKRQTFFVCLGFW